NEDTVKKPRCVCIGAGIANFVNVAQKGGQVQAFNMKPVIEGRGAFIEPPSAPTLAPWKLKDDVEKPTSIAISNLLLMFAAEEGEGKVVVTDLARSGALVCKIADPKV